MCSGLLVTTTTFAKVVPTSLTSKVESGDDTPVTRLLGKVCWVNISNDSVFNLADGQREREFTCEDILLALQEIVLHLLNSRGQVANHFAIIQKHYVVSGGYCKLSGST